MAAEQAHSCVAASGTARMQLDCADHMMAGQLTDLSSHPAAQNGHTHYSSLTQWVLRQNVAGQDHQVCYVSS